MLDLTLLSSTNRSSINIQCEGFSYSLMQMRGILASGISPFNCICSHVSALHQSITNALVYNSRNNASKALHIMLSITMNNNLSDLFVLVRLFGLSLIYVPITFHLVILM